MSSNGVIDIQKITEELLADLGAGGSALSRQAEGVRILYDRIRDAIKQHTESERQAAQAQQSSEQAVQGSGDPTPGA